MAIIKTKCWWDKYDCSDGQNIVLNTDHIALARLDFMGYQKPRPEQEFKLGRECVELTTNSGRIIYVDLTLDEFYKVATATSKDFPDFRPSESVKVDGVQ